MCSGAVLAPLLLAGKRPGRPSLWSKRQFVDPVAGAGRCAHHRVEPPGGVATEPADHALRRSHGWTTRLHLACEQGGKLLSMLLTAEHAQTAHNSPRCRPSGCPASVPAGRRWPSASPPTPRTWPGRALTTTPAFTGPSWARAIPGGIRRMWSLGSAPSTLRHWSCSGVCRTCSGRASRRITRCGSPPSAGRTSGAATAGHLPALLVRRR